MTTAATGSCWEAARTSSLRTPRTATRNPRASSYCALRAGGCCAGCCPSPCVRLRAAWHAREPRHGCLLLPASPSKVLARSCSQSSVTCTILRLRGSDGLPRPRPPRRGAITCGGRSQAERGVGAVGGLAGGCGAGQGERCGRAPRRTRSPDPRGGPQRITTLCFRADTRPATPWPG